MVYPCLRIIYFCNANRRYRAPLPGHDLSASLRFTFLVYPLSLRATTTIYIVTGGAVLYSLSLRWGKFSDGRNFTDEYPHAKYSRAERGRTTFSHVHSVVTTLEIASRNATRLPSKNLHVRDRPILVSGQVSVPDLRNSSCREVDLGRGRLFTYETGGGSGRRRQALMPMHHAYSKLRHTAVRRS